MLEVRPLKEAPGLSELLRELGLDVVPLINGLDIKTWHRFHADEQRRRFEALMAKVVQESGIRSIPIRAAQCILVDDWQELGLVAKTAPTVGAGIERLLRYKDLRSRAD